VPMTDAFWSQGPLLVIFRSDSGSVASIWHFDLVGRFAVHCDALYVANLWCA